MAAGTSGRSDRHNTSGGSEPERAAAAAGQTSEASDTPQRQPLPGEERAAAPAAPAASLSRLSLPARLEAILYLKGRPVPLAELAALAGIEPEEAELALITLMTDYAHRETALEIHQEGQRFSLQLRESHVDLVQSLVPVDLSTAALRTLATIALKKRILQTELVELRGSGAYDHIKELLAQDFIERRRQSDGRSYWLSLSEKFHRTFALQTDDLADADRRPAPWATDGGPA
jgi:segregation and condensation protein B